MGSSRFSIRLFGQGLPLLLALQLASASAPASAMNLQDKWQAFYQKNWRDNPVTLTQQELSQYPTELLLSTVQYPDFKHYTWQDIQQLSAIKSNCAVPKLIDDKLKTAVEFELMLCSKPPVDDDKLDITWFNNHSLRYPAGASYADRYFRQKGITKISAPFQTYLSADNPAHPLYSFFQSLSPKGRDALLSGYRAWLDGDTLWLSGKEGWKKITANIWQPLAKQLGIKIGASNCAFRYSNLCLSDQKPNSTLLKFTLLLLLFGMTILGLKSLRQRQQQNRDKRFILQLLTHELRTPIASLGLTVEMFRDEFDNLNQTAQQAVWRLLADHQRLAQLTETSKGYLSTDKNQQLIQQVAELEEWLTHVCDKHGISFQLDENHTLTLPFYWLSICLDNLINNAKQHGKGSIRIHVEMRPPTQTIFRKKKKTLRISVSDQGRFPSFIERWLIWLSPQKHPDNMGIGLSIVTRLMTQMGGRLIIERKPTSCILEMPL
ncbi:DUF3404 domain-containing protein [Photobacterium sanguinicancri]|uniref:ATP-binding protein n=1 Tax=Photobacterium sanguinicancri TaxID=875932 RepID=UPI0009F8D4C4|nr:DUF3404 domain-containing protein [Photobacterium sanguinicancri]